MSTHSRWIQSVDDETRRRLAMLRALSESETGRRLVIKHLSQDNVESLVAFGRDFATTLDPRNKPPLPKALPLILWPRQEALLRELYAAESAGENLIVEKSRDTGVTVTVLGVYYLWRWLWTPGWVGGVGSRKEELLDKVDDPNTAFAKIRKTLYSLPVWMMPHGYDRRRHDNHRRIVNPSNGAAILGEAGDNVGRGARVSMYALDEFGKMERPDSVEAAVSGTTDTVVYISTATPMGTAFHTLVTSGKAPVFRFHWRDDPRKDDAWYAKFRGKWGPVITALEVDIDYQGGADDTFIPYQWVSAAIDAFTDIDPSEPICAGFDVAGGGTAEHVYITRQGHVTGEVVAWSGDDPTVAAQTVATHLVDDGVTQLNYDMVGVGAGAGTVIEQRLVSENVQNVTVNGVNSGSACDIGHLPDSDEATCKDRFANLKAQLWWQLRIRFENTYRKLILGEDIDARDCISIPNDPLLVSQLCTPKQVVTSNGKVGVERKEVMARRGAPSPDRADALVLAFAESVENTRWQVALRGKQEVRHQNNRARNELTRLAVGRRRF